MIPKTGYRYTARDFVTATSDGDGNTLVHARYMHARGTACTWNPLGRYTPEPTERDVDCPDCLVALNAAGIDPAELKHEVPTVVIPAWAIEDEKKNGPWIPPRMGGRGRGRRSR